MLLLRRSLCSFQLYAIDAPQTRDEFVARVKKGGVMKDAESLTVSRPFKTVAADLRQFADQCLNVTHRIRANHMTKDNGGVTYYQAKVDTSKAGLVTLSLQGEQPRMHGHSRLEASTGWWLKSRARRLHRDQSLLHRHARLRCR